MRKILLTLLLLFFFIVFPFLSIKNIVLAEDAVSPVITKEVNSFELFWPIVAGKVRGDSLYSLKTFKERVREFFIFDSVKKAKYYSFLSTKRLVEYEELILVRKDFENAQETLRQYNSNMLKGNDKEVYENQKIFITSLVTKVDESQKILLEKELSALSSHIDTIW